MKVLIIGSGGREHAIAYALNKSDKVSEIHAIPGNPGISKIGTCHKGSVEDLEGILKFVEDNQIDYTVVGPEVPLCLGLVDLGFSPRSEWARFEVESFSKKGRMMQSQFRSEITTVCISAHYFSPKLIISVQNENWAL